MEGSVWIFKGRAGVIKFKVGGRVSEKLGRQEKGCFREEEKGSVFSVWSVWQISRE